MGREYKIKVINLSGKLVNLDVNSKMTVEELKKEILNPGQFSDCFFVFEGKLLTSDDKTLEFYKVIDNSTIYVLARVRGGFP